MKHDQMRHAEALYMQTSLSKTELADNLGISRTTLYTWAQDNDWDRLKSNARHMPALMAENMYFVLGNKLNSVLAAYNIGKTVPLNDLNMICKLTNAIHKNTSRNTINETMELRNYFIEYLQENEPAMVAAVAPLIDGFIRSRAKPNPKKYIPVPAPGKTQPVRKEENERALNLAMEHIKARSMNGNAEEQPVNATDMPDNLKSINEFLGLADQFAEDHPGITAMPVAAPQMPKPVSGNTGNLNRAQRRLLERNAKKKNQQKQAA